MARYRNMQVGDAAEIVARPHYFGALMTQYGQADGLVGGNKALPAALFRALINTIKPLPNVPKIFGAMVLVGDHLYLDPVGLQRLARELCGEHRVARGVAASGVRQNPNAAPRQHVENRTACGGVDPSHRHRRELGPGRREGGV